MTWQDMTPDGWIEDRVARGVAILDERVPNWRAKVNAARLRIESSCDCVLGQINGTFSTGLDLVYDAATHRELYVDYDNSYLGYDAITLPKRDARRQWALDHGFLAHDCDVIEIESEWRKHLGQYVHA